MIRSEILQEIAPIRNPHFVVCNFGLPSQELHRIDDNATGNYKLLIIDNGSYGSTDDQPTYAGQKTSLTAVAKACGCENVIEMQDKDLGPVLQVAIDIAIDIDEMTIIVCNCGNGNIKLPVITLAPVVMRHRFMEAVKA